MKKHKILIGLVLAAVIFAAPTVFAQVYHIPPKAQKASEPLDIEVWTNKDEGETFGQGENLVIYFRVNRDCYVTIYDLDTKGNINLLFPFSSEDEHFVEAGVVYTIPDYYDDYVLRVNGPPGIEFIQAIASQTYFEVPEWEYNFRDPDVWHEINQESEAIRYLEYINHNYFPVENCYGRCDLDYTFFKVRKNWKYSWDSYYYDDYEDEYSEVHHYYHPYYYRPVYYDPWWDPWDWYGVVYIDYPYGGAIWIDGVYYGCAPLFIPRICIGWHNVRILHGGNVYYHDRVKVRRGIRHGLYHEGGYKWKTNRRGLVKNDQLVKKHYPKSKSLSYKSSAKYSAGGKAGNTKVYKAGSKTSKYNTKATYKGAANKSKTGKNSYGKSGKAIKSKSKISSKSKGSKSSSSKNKSSSKVTKSKSKSSSSKDKSSSKVSKGSKSSDKNKSSKSKKSESKKSGKTMKSTNSRFQTKSESKTYITAVDKSSSSRKSGKKSSSYSGSSKESSSRTKAKAHYEGKKATSSSSSKSSSKSNSKSGSVKSSKSKSSSSSSKKSSGSYSGGSKSKSSGGSKSSRSSGSKSKRK
jgi:Domain of unknown function (DUF4384)